ncbi:MAG: DUF1989 domain-containing protein [Candidatus Methylomirabilia bacterium]
MKPPQHRAEVVAGKVLEDQVLVPDTAWARVIPEGAVLRIVDLEGKQAVDFFCYNNANLFMNVPVESDGRMGIADGFSVPGGFGESR